MDSSPRITRRGFLAGAACGLAAGAPLAWLAARRFPTFSGRSTEDKQPEYAMPGSFEGRVIRVHNPGAVRPKDLSFDAEVVRKMVHRGVVALVDGDLSDPKSAWQRFFNSDDVVGIKVNPVGRKPKPAETDRVHGAAGCISSPEVLVAIVEALKEVG